VNKSTRNLLLLGGGALALYFLTRKKPEVESGGGGGGGVPYYTSAFAPGPPTQTPLFVFHMGGSASGESVPAQPAPTATGTGTGTAFAQMLAKGSYSLSGYESGTATLLSTGQTVKISNIPVFQGTGQTATGQTGTVQQSLFTLPLGTPTVKYTETRIK
jgi:hypothetical protein